MSAKRFLTHFIFFGVVLLSLSSCSRTPCEKYLKHPPYTPPEKLVSIPKPINVIQRREYDICVLQTHGVQVIRMGQTWKLVFPSDDLFDNDTAEINENYKPLLNVAADFMQSYPKIAVKVASYTNPSAEDIKTKFGSVLDELTERQAEAVANYFHHRHINYRLLYSIGEGSHHPVAWNGAPNSRRYNRRVEVSFRYYRDNTAWY
jgi:outer membrane protein OmpA-like peptidoglycan-associated protein